MKLTNTACKNAKPDRKPYKRFDGGPPFQNIRKINNFDGDDKFA